MSGRQDQGEWLAERAAQRPRLVTGAGQIIAGGGRSNDAVLHGRQWLENRLGADPEAEITGRDYRHAAYRIGRIADSSIRPEHSEILETIADADGELAAARPRWANRYLGRPDTLSERRTTGWLTTGSLTERGKSVVGVDGGVYRQAFFRKGSRPAVVVTNSALTQDAVVFLGIPEARRWWESRRLQSGSLMTTADLGVPARPAQEEEVLAWLVQQPSNIRAVTADLGPSAMTSHLRAELFEALAWTTKYGGSPEPQTIAEAFGRRLLRAPGWVDVGWPGASIAANYLQRMLATPVSGGQAKAAVKAIAASDAEAVQFRDANPEPPPGAARAERAAHRDVLVLQQRRLEIAQSSVQEVPNSPSAPVQRSR